MLTCRGDVSRRVVSTEYLSKHSCAFEVLFDHGFHSFSVSRIHSRMLHINICHGLLQDSRRLVYSHGCSTQLVLNVL